MTNLVLIDCHDLGQHLACYGWSAVPSDNLDALAATGIRFENSFCTAPQCSPSRAGLYTGRYPHANGMFGLAHEPFGWRMHKDEVHLAKLLQEAGYYTIQIGTQHVTAQSPDAIQQLGFDEVHMGDDAIQNAQQVETVLASMQQQPFFLNIGFFEPHRDPQGYFHQAPPDHTKGVSLPPYVPHTPESEGEFAQLQGIIRKLDEAVGIIWQALQTYNLLQDTWLIFTTDHGIAMPRAKTTMYDPGIETALMMHAEPFGFTGGRVYQEMVSNVDIVPTILQGLGISAPDNLQGRSFWPLLNGDDYSPREHIFAEKTFHTAYEPQRAVRTDRYKLIWNAEVDIINVAADIQHSPIFPQMIEELTKERPPFELYDLQADPVEQRNLAGQPTHAEIEQQLRKALLRWMQVTDDPLLIAPIPSPYYDRARRLLYGEDA
ncbi:MAG: sulfatase [Anaerolineae bacterium]|nr:sulfatase [Anaerolineae bacterium]